MTSAALTLRIGTVEALVGYLATQLAHLFPAPQGHDDVDVLMKIVPRALGRMAPILDAVRMFEANRFDHYNSLQYASFLYLASNEASRDNSLDASLAERLFLLNRALNAIDLFHAITLPEVFFISHGLGSVLGNVEYGNRLVIFHNVTVGRVEQDRPTIGANVVLFPGAVVTGRSRIGDYVVISAGCVVHDEVVPDNSLVSQVCGELKIRARTKDYTGIYLR